jgi:transketolase
MSQTDVLDEAGAEPISAGVESLAINTIRTLSMDAVEKAKSGHFGTAMGAAPVVYELWQNHLRYDPNDPLWPNRDRFVLSVGHASMLLYSILHLTGVKEVDHKGQLTGNEAVSIDDIKKFRQVDSKCPGHPEFYLTSGVESTTGPLGQGVANSVGMAIAAKVQANYFNKPGFPLFDYNVYALAGDGCMMEGVSQEAASLAGHLALSNLCWIYDSNHVTIDGDTKISFNENTLERFKAYGWHTIEVMDANDIGAMRAALDEFKRTADKPTFIMVHSIIGYGAPKAQGTNDAHGEGISHDDLIAAKKLYGWPLDKEFYVPEEVTQHFIAGIGQRGKQLHAAWTQLASSYAASNPELATHMMQMQKRELPSGWDKDFPVFEPDEKGIATRESSGKMLETLGKNVPWLIGGAADLVKSTKTFLKGQGAMSPTEVGRNINFGIREHAMGSIANGLAVSNMRAFDSTFLIFSDYMRNPIRLSALMEIPVIHIFTHDSIGVGEDGPTHQPVEQIGSLRMIPGMIVLRPADANEVVEAWRVIMKQTHHPVCLILSRQNLPTWDRTKFAPASGVAKGAYVMRDSEGGAPQVILIATGSEVQLIVGAQKELEAKGIRSRIVSMPSWELFEKQEQSYRDSVLPPSIRARVSVEQASTMGWDRWVGMDGAKIGMHTFGASAPLKDLLTKFGFTAEKIVEAAVDQVAKNSK